MTADEALLVAALDRIEQREARLLSWGLVDGFLTSGEAADIIDGLLDDPRFADEEYEQPLRLVSAAEVIEALKARALLFDVAAGTEPRYRSRMAETVRLLFRLRQLFPKPGPDGLAERADTGGGLSVHLASAALSRPFHCTPRHPRPDWRGSNGRKHARSFSRTHPRAWAQVQAGAVPA